MLVAAFCAYCPPSVVAHKASSPTPQSTAQPHQSETLADPLFTDLLTPHHVLPLTGACRHYHNLSQRVRANQSISMLSIGSSVTGVEGGCTHAVPAICSDSKCPHCCGAQCGYWGNEGWARDVFDMFNESWPHKDSALRSLGQPGGGLAPMIIACLANLVTFRVEIFLLELRITGGAFSQIDKLVRLLVTSQHEKYGHAPLVVFTSFGSVVDPFIANEEYVRRQGRSILTIAARYMATQSFRPMRSSTCPEGSRKRTTQTTCTHGRLPSWRALRRRGQQVQWAGVATIRRTSRTPTPHLLVRIHAARGGAALPLLGLAWGRLGGRSSLCPST
jgi:hypothetical protein